MPIILQSLVNGIRIYFGTLYLLFILISIPISFKIGGLHCGLSFTVTLFNLYFILTTLNILARRRGSKVAVIVTSLLYYCQHLIIASLLYLFLSGFADSELTEIVKQGGESTATLTEVLRNNLNSVQSNWKPYYYYYKYVVQPWRLLLSYSTPFFTLSEGFFTILAIQAIGETNRWLSYEKNSNVWIISSLLVSGGIITAALYYLHRVYVTPFWHLSVQTASLLGFVLSLVAGLGIYGIVTECGSVIESSLFFAYIVRCIYEISPKLATTATEEVLELFKEVWQQRQGSLPITENLLFYYNNVILKNTAMIWDSIVSRNFWTSSHHFYYPLPTTANISGLFHPIWKFFKNFTASVPFSISELAHILFNMATESVSPAVVINLCFRILIFYSATRIIPALQRTDSRERKRSRRMMKIIYLYSPCILIAMYTHLVLQYSGELKSELCLWGCNSKWLPAKFQPSGDGDKFMIDAWGFWNWCNIFLTILIYGNELFSTVPNNAADI